MSDRLIGRQRPKEHTSVEPEHYVVLIGVAPALEEPEEEVFSLDVDIARVGPRSTG
jgi:hypothetical protein